MSEVIRLSLVTKFVTYSSNIQDRFKLISMGIVPIDNQDIPSFYEVRKDFTKPSISKRAELKTVMEKLFDNPFEGKQSLPQAKFQGKLSTYFYRMAQTVPTDSSVEIWSNHKEAHQHLLRKKISDKAFAKLIENTAISSISHYDISDLGGFIQGGNAYFDAHEQAKLVKFSGCTEYLSMNAWLRLPKDKKALYVATGVPVRDPSSQLKPK